MGSDEAEIRRRKAGPAGVEQRDAVRAVLGDHHASTDLVARLITAAKEFSMGFARMLMMSCAAPLAAKSAMMSLPNVSKLIPACIAWLCTAMNSCE